MRKLIFCLILTVGCSEKKTESAPDNSFTKQKDSVQTEKIPVADNIVLNAWETYYQQQNPDFSFQKFSRKSENAITRLPSSDRTVLDADFDEVYKPFLVYSPDSTKYVDFDSYQWNIDSDGFAGFEADQKVVLVDLQKKTAEQIAFFGPSFWIEDGFWKNNKEVVLLGNTYEKVPFYISYDLERNVQQFFQYSDTLNFETPYSAVRLRSKGVKTE